MHDDLYEFVIDMVCMLIATVAVLYAVYGIVNVIKISSGSG